MQNNALVDFLAAYGPTSDGNNMYDEFVVNAAVRAGVEPIEIGEGRSAGIVADLEGLPGRSVVLTGTAGDGKTYTARKVLSLLGKNPAPVLDEITHHQLENGRRVVFVKDLSEVSEDTKAVLVPRMVASFSSPDPSEVFVLCVNDGTLLRSWEAHSGGSEEGAAILAQFRGLLRDDGEIPPAGMSFRLINMSRTSHASTIDAIIEAICNHPRWSDCSNDCAAHAAGRCPIEINRAILLKTGEASMRERLRALVEISAADDRHLSIRQIIVLIVNALLGDAKNGYVSPLLNCARANQRGADGEFRFTNPYSNVFGENHPAFRRDQNTAFSALAEFAIGYETNNYFDDVLMEAEVGVDHPQYGFAGYDTLRHSYRENPSQHIDELRRVLTAQRRRLFFEWPDQGPEDRDRSPWQLSVHTYGDLYLNLLRRETERDQEKFRKTRPRLIKGLNRALTGSLTETSDRLWLTQPSGVYKGADIPFLVTSPIGWVGRPYSLTLAPPARHGRSPELQLHAAYPEPAVLASLEMTPTLFEYLMRVSDGALPMSFSNQCFQDVRNFQIRCVGRILELQGDDTPSFSAVDAEGETLQERPINALEEEV
jgi:hypothetical protein